MDRGPRHIVALVEQLQQAADACPERWGTEAGPADRAALDLFCLLALRSGSTVLNLDARRAALATGYGRSTMHRAFGRSAATAGWPRRGHRPSRHVRTFTRARVSYSTLDQRTGRAGRVHEPDASGGPSLRGGIVVGRRLGGVQGLVRVAVHSLDDRAPEGATNLGDAPRTPTASLRGRASAVLSGPREPQQRYARPTDEGAPR